MNEAECLVSADPAAMLAHIDPPGPPRASLRKLRLFAAACLRMDGLEKTATALEQFADDGDELALLGAWRTGRPPIAFGTVAGTRIYAADLAKIGQPGPRSQVLRCIFNPFRPVTHEAVCTACSGEGCSESAQHHDSEGVKAGHRCNGSGRVTRPGINPQWLTSTVLAHAQAIYQDRAWELMPALADALEEAGCTDEAMLGHARGLMLEVKPCPACKGKKIVLGPQPNNSSTGPQTCQKCEGSGSVIGGWVHPRCPRCATSDKPGWVWGHNHAHKFSSYFECQGCKGTGHAPAVYCRGDWALDLMLGKE